MIQDIYDPLTEYDNTFRSRFREIAEQTFDELAKEGQIDVNANLLTCQKKELEEGILKTVKTHLARWKFLCYTAWIVAVIGLSILAFRFSSWPVWLSVIVGIIAVAVIVVMIWKVHPKIKALKGDSSSLEVKIAKLEQEAWDQMKALNELYDWDVLSRMMCKTVPKLEFDPYFTEQRLADLQNTYHWDDSFSQERSVVYSHSGLINGNPFVICRTKKMNMGEKTYTGSLTIHWTTIEHDSDGNSYTKDHSETLRAEVTAPYPEYYEKTRVFYGNTAAPDLIFNRKKEGLAGNEKSLAYKWTRRELRKKSQDLKNSDYAMMTNEEFEVLFNTSDRNNNQQFALLFTPLAQESMLALLRDDKIGYGDDFSFSKQRMINVIIPDHLQDINIDLNPSQFIHYDYNKAKENFVATNAKYFRAVYFALAPLLCVPAYQQIRPQEAIYGRDMQKHSSFWEHEALANFWGKDHFKHPDCVTDCILKTDLFSHDDDEVSVIVYAYGYKVEKRTTYIQKYGGDGKYHNVPVNWDEYIPVTGFGQMDMKEDNKFEENQNTTQKQRLQHIREFTNNFGADIYRRHITSKVTPIQPE